MLVAAWFLFVFTVILFGFGLVFATFFHWYKESKALKKSAALKAALEQPQT